MSKLKRKYLVIDNTNNGINAQVLPVSATPTNYTPQTTEVSGHLTGIDNKLGEFVDLLNVTSEPTGFPPTAVSSISFANLTRTFTISGTYNYYIKGVKYSKNGSTDVVISNVTGVHHIYFNGSTLTETTTFTTDILSIYCYVAAVYWDATNSVYAYLGDERHQMIMDSATHSYLHLTRGTQYISGLGLSNFTLDASGNVNTHAQFNAASGVISDEDIRLTIGASTLTANIPVWYLEGASAIWRRQAPTGYPVRTFVGGSSRLAYNQFTGGAWQQTEVTNADYVLCHLFATNDIDNRYIAIQGQAQYTTAANARAGASVEIANLVTTGLPAVEFVAVASIIYQTNNTYTNGAKARIVTADTTTGAGYINFIGQDISPTTSPTVHNNLGGLQGGAAGQYYHLSSSEYASIAGAAGDIKETAFSFTNNSTGSVTGFVFSNAVVRSFSALVSVTVDATSDLYESFELRGIQRGADWQMIQSSVGDNSGMLFEINSSGQITYTSGNYAGFVSGSIHFRATVTLI